MKAYLLFLLFISFNFLDFESSLTDLIAVLSLN